MPTASKTEYGRTFTAEYVVRKDVCYWVSNDAVCPLDACQEYGIPHDPMKQRAALDAEGAKWAKAYRKAQKGRRPSAEECFEMEAAFGRGVDVVDVISGRRHRT